MQQHSIELAVAPRDVTYAPSAIRHLALVQAGIVATLVGEHINLQGNVPADALARHWQIALVNERLVAEADPHRADLLGRLVA